MRLRRRARQVSSSHFQAAALMNAFIARLLVASAPLTGRIRFTFRRILPVILGIYTPPLDFFFFSCKYFQIIIFGKMLFEAGRPP